MASYLDSKDSSTNPKGVDIESLALESVESGIGSSLTLDAADGRRIHIWVARIDGLAERCLQDARQASEDFVADPSHRPGTCRILTFSLASDSSDSKTHERPTFLVTLRAERDHHHDHRPSQDDHISDMTNLDLYEGKPLLDQPLPTVRKARRWKSKTLIMVFAIICLLVMGAVGPLIHLLPVRSTQYERYPTPGSIGPKHQGRLQWSNATEWARRVDFDDSRWRVRIDDQALVPAELWDEDEERYQRWFRQRYPHLQEVVERHDYLRPSWLGSSQIAVPWDEQFHFAHCVLALRRYWIAKETGRHVCGRDIDYAHMKHCLDSLDEKAFPPGPMDDIGKGYRLWWQTKVCYD